LIHLVPALGNLPMAGVVLLSFKTPQIRICIIL
jgi:hypothetical protein